MTLPVAIAHDYLTQRGGAERVVLELARAFPDAPIHTSLYDPEGTYPAFGSLPVVTSPLDRVAALRQRHRLALPLLAPTFSAMRVDARVVVCSSAGWAHGVRTRGEVVVYCHAPARWLYQTDRYFAGKRGPQLLATPLLAGLRVWDRRQAGAAARYLVNSSATLAMVRDAYGIEAEVLHPPLASALHDVAPVPVAGVEPGALLAVSRLLPYKNVHLVAEAARITGRRLVVVGEGPAVELVRAAGGDAVQLLGGVSDGELRWLYERCEALVTCSYEDFGLTPVEAASFGRPTVALRFGGFLDTIVDGTTGTFVDEPTVDAIGAALELHATRTFDPGVLRAHAAGFGADRFAARLRAVVREVDPLAEPDRGARV